MDELSKNPNVEYAEPNYLFHLDSPPNDPHFGVQWALHNTGQEYPVTTTETATGTADRDVDGLEAFDSYIPGDSPIVAVVDSGVHFQHFDLRDNIWAPPGTPAPERRRSNSRLRRR